MSDLAQPVQQAIWQALQAGVTLAPVFTVVPDKTQPPVVVISDSEIEQIGGKSSNAEQHDVTVRLFVPGTSKAGLFALAAQVKAALHNQVLPAQPGAAISRCAFVSAGELRDIDEGTLIEEMRFRLFASPA